MVLFWAALWLTVLTTPGSAVGVVPVDRSETEAQLMSFYAAVGGPRWLRQDGWSEGVASGTDPRGGTRDDAQPPRWCRWEGIECEKMGPSSYVMVGLSLPQNRLSGHLPLDLMCDGIHHATTAFSFLRLLNVSGNQLVGDGLVFQSEDASCPNHSGIFSHLTTLDLSFNRFNASMKSFLLRSIPKLRFATARGNVLQGPILSTTDFPQGGQSTSSSSVRFPLLEVLDLGQNRLLGQFPTVAFAFHTPHLRVLRLDNNFFIDPTFSWLHVPAAQGVGSGLGWHFSLSVLDVQNNYIQATIPGTVAQYVNLRELIADGNRIYGTLPHELRSLRLLSTLSLAHNFLRGTLPCESGGWFSQHTPFLELRVLDVTDNDLDGPLCAVHRDHSIEVLRLADNAFSGPLPPLRGSRLREVTLGGENQWTCELPDASNIPGWMDPPPSSRCVVTASLPAAAEAAHERASWFTDDPLLFLSPRRRSRSGGSSSAQDFYRRNVTALAGTRLSPFGVHLFSAALTIFLLVPLSVAVASAAGIELPTHSVLHMLLPWRFLRWIEYSPAAQL